MTKEPFDVHIKNLLKPDVSQPIIKLGINADTSAQEVLEVCAWCKNNSRNRV